MAERKHELWGQSRERRLPLRPLVEGVHWKVDTETGCWEWLQFRMRGYGRHRFGQAHRIVWRQFGYPEIPLGYHLHHKCENHGCVNPDHLEPREHASHLRGHWATWGPVNPSTVAAIRDMGRSTTLTQTAIGEHFGLPRTTVSSILNGQSWSDGVRALPEGRICPQCGDPVEGRRSKRYCSVECRHRFNSAKSREAA